MNIRRAEEKDMDRINDLLFQVCLVHHKGRPDLFKYGAKKYTDEQLLAIIQDDQRPIFVAEDSDQVVQGYAFCIFSQHIDDNILTDIKTLYIDDLCVDQSLRGQHIGESLFESFHKGTDILHRLAIFPIHLLRMSYHHFIYRFLCKIIVQPVRQLFCLYGYQRISRNPERVRYG